MQFGIQMLIVANMPMFFSNPIKAIGSETLFQSILNLKLNTFLAVRPSLQRNLNQLPCNLYFSVYL